MELGGEGLPLLGRLLAMLFCIWSLLLLLVLALAWLLTGGVSGRAPLRFWLLGLRLGLLGLKFW